MASSATVCCGDYPGIIIRHYSSTGNPHFDFISSVQDLLVLDIQVSIQYIINLKLRMNRINPFCFGIRCRFILDFHGNNQYRQHIDNSTICGVKGAAGILKMDAAI